MDRITCLAILTAALTFAVPSGKVYAETQVYEVVEETFIANKTYANPYLDVDLWVTLTGPGGMYRIPAFWDGGGTFRARLVATKPGDWQWSTGNQTGDSGLDNKSGSFRAVAWTETEKKANPNRRGFIRAMSNHRALEYADGTPFFYTGDTWWAALTRIYSWSSSEGESQISFQDALNVRKNQGFNGINMIACFPTDTRRSIWASGDKVAEDGATPFEMSRQGDRDFSVDYTRINPAYWQQADRKWKYMWENGFAPYLETVRRHERWPEENSAEKAAFTNYIRYLWARWGCYNMIFSWLHMDAGDAEKVQAWRPMVVAAHAALRDMPYGQPKTIMCPGSSLRDWYSLSPRILDVNSVSNTGRDGASITWLREMFFIADPLPVFNIEPYYPGVGGWHPKPVADMKDGQMAQFLMYGCVLNGGGLVGHAWGDCYWGGVATLPKPPVSLKDPHKNGFHRWTAASMGKLKEFVLDNGHDYRVLVPAVETNLANPDGEFLALALAPDKSQGLGFVSANKDSCDIIKLTPNADYRIEWWHVDNGGWQNDTIRQTDNSGRLSMPSVTRGGEKRGWAFRIRKVDKPVKKELSILPSDRDFTWRHTETSVALLNHGRVVWQHEHDRKIGKPYMRVGLLDGTELTRPWPIPADYPKRDHTWHRALWWSWKGINGINFWEQHQQGTDPVDVTVRHQADGSAAIDATLEYHLPDQPPVVIERRSIRISKPNAGGNYLIDWRATFTSAANKDIVFNRNGFGGLAIRMAAELSGDDRQGPPPWEFIRSTEPEGTRNGAARWMAYTGTAQNGRPAVIVIFVHPDNPRFPPSWCLRNHYPYMNPCFIAGEDYTLVAGTTLALRYGILIHAGTADPEEFDRTWRRFADSD